MELFESKLIKRNGAPVGVSLKLTLHEAIMLKTVLAHISGIPIENSNSRYHTDSVSNKLERLGFRYLEEAGLFATAPEHYFHEDHETTLSEMRFTNGSCARLNSAVSEFLDNYTTSTRPGDTN